jgi:hypothetical protein
MPEKTSCPSCNAILHLPDDMVGQQVRCPQCQQTFTAQLKPPVEPEGIVGDRPAVRPRYSPPEAPRQPYVPLDDDYSGYGRPRRDSQDAETAVLAPAIAMMVLGGFDIVLMILNGFFIMRDMAAAGPNGDPAYLIGEVIGGGLGLIFAILILTGGIRMKQLQSHSLAVTAAVIALLPCGNCCIIGLPIGIWALVVLNRPEVKEAFR